jgi:hypothetical protein
MNLNLLDLLNQIKKFAAQETGNIFSLVAYFLLSLIVLSRYFWTSVSIKYADYNVYVLLSVFAFIIIVRSCTRKIHKDPGKINIGIAQVNLLNTSMEKPLDWEQKLSISSELSNYIYNCLSHNKQELLMDKHLNFFRLPSRIAVNYANCDQMVDTLDIDMLIRWICRYHKEKFYIDYKVATKKHINSIFFDKLINDINAYPEIQFDFSGQNNLEFDKFIHMISYLSIIYKSLELINATFHFEEIEKLLLHAINCLHKLYADKTDQSVNEWDKDVVKIEILLYFILAKNYFNRANSLMENFDYKNEANEKLDQSTSATDKEMDLIKKYLERKKYASIYEQIELENAYIYTLWQLGKTQNKKTITKQLKNVDEIIKDKYKFDLVKAFIETIFKDVNDAKKHYEEALHANPNNTVALRWLWLLEYDQKNFSKAREYLDKLNSISQFHIFQPHLYDLKLQKTLYKIDMKKWYIRWAIKHVFLFIKFKAENKKILKKNYTL